MPNLACRKCYTFDIDQKGRCKGCKSNRYIINVDSGLYDVLKTLWGAGIFTDNCCEGHIDMERFYAYMMFSPSYRFCDWLNAHKEEYEREFFPISIATYDRGFSQITLAEYRSGEFSPEKREKCAKIFKSALQKLAEDYIGERKHAP